jgi:hypothetical protein
VIGHPPVIVEVGRRLLEGGELLGLGGVHGGLWFGGGRLYFFGIRSGYAVVTELEMRHWGGTLSGGISNHFYVCRHSLYSLLLILIWRVTSLSLPFFSASADDDDDDDGVNHDEVGQESPCQASLTHTLTIYIAHPN